MTFRLDAPRHVLQQDVDKSPPVYILIVQLIGQTVQIVVYRGGVVFFFSNFLSVLFVCMCVTGGGWSSFLVCLSLADILPFVYFSSTKLCIFIN